jgi:large subunit ribosomal protein L19
MLQQIDFAPGDVVQVFQKIAEGDKTRTQMFEGTVLSIRGRGENKTFMVRKLVGDIAVERIWPLGSPNIEQIKVKAKPKKRVRRAKLFHLRKGTPKKL